MDMGKSTRVMWLTAAAIAAGLSLQTSVARAIIIGFEAGQGYTADTTVVNAPSTAGATKWAGDAAASTKYYVRADAGGQVLSTTAGGSSLASFHPSTADLNLGSGTVASSVIQYSYDVRVNSTLDTGLTLFRVRLGADGSGGNLVSDFELSSQGLFRYTETGSSGSLIAKDSKSVNFVATPGSFFTVSGEMNFATNKFTLFVNGVQQKDSSGGTTLDFKTSNLTALYLTSRLITNTGGSSTFSLDNITLAAVPEPASVGILGISAGALILRRKK